MKLRKGNFVKKNFINEKISLTGKILSFCTYNVSIYLRNALCDFQCIYSSPLQLFVFYFLFHLFIIPYLTIVCPSIYLSILLVLPSKEGENQFVGEIKQQNKTTSAQIYFNQTNFQSFLCMLTTILPEVQHSCPGLLDRS